MLYTKLPRAVIWSLSAPDNHDAAFIFPLTSASFFISPSLFMDATPFHPCVSIRATLLKTRPNCSVNFTPRIQQLRILNVLLSQIFKKTKNYRICSNFLPVLRKCCVRFPVWTHTVPVEVPHRLPVSVHLKPKQYVKYGHAASSSPFPSL